MSFAAATVGHILFVLPPDLEIGLSNLLQLDLKSETRTIRCMTGAFACLERPVSTAAHLKRLREFHEVLLHRLAGQQIRLQGLYLRFEGRVLLFELVLDRNATDEIRDWTGNSAEIIARLVRPMNCSRAANRNLLWLSLIRYSTLEARLFSSHRPAWS